MNILLVDDERHVLQELEDAVSEAIPTAQCFSFQSTIEALAFAETTHIDIAFWDINMHFMRLFLGDIFSAHALTYLCPACKIVYCIAHDEYVSGISRIEQSVYLLKTITTEKVHDALARLRRPVNE